MKRAKRSSNYDEQPDPMRDLNVELGSSDEDDDIIDLEDIIEMPDSPIDEDEDLDLDIDNFDVDSMLQSEPKKTAQSFKLDSEEDDLINSFDDEPEEDEELFGSGEPSAGKPAMKRKELEVFDEDEESLLDEFMENSSMSEAGVLTQEEVDLKPGAGAAKPMSDQAWSTEVGPKCPISDETPEPAPSKAAAPANASGPPSADPSQIAEELVGQIESHLQDYIRAMVESRLPELVRSIIHEEVEKLKKELELK
jgi:hypothetical protein